MLRADYCGNGIVHTREGTPIEIYDRLNIQQLTENSNPQFEAAWSSEGAIRVSRTRYANMLQQLQKSAQRN